MASAGPLLLLLMSTSLVLSSLSAPPPPSHPDRRFLQKRGKMKRFLTAMEYTDKIAKALNPFIGLIPVAGYYINKVLSISTAITEITKKDKMMAFLKVEFQNLNGQIDRYHTQKNWELLTNVYQKYENDIKTASEELQTLQKGWNGFREDEKMTNLKIFKEYFGDKCLSSTANLHTSLTSSHASFNSKFGKGLMDYSRCHEKIIKDFTILIADLSQKGNAVSHFIYQQSGIDKTDQLAKYAYESASVMFEIHKQCILNIDSYIRLDIKDFIDVNKERGKLAKEIREFLQKEFDRYDWIAVAFITKNSQHDTLKNFNRHILSDAFIREEKGEVTVAVAKQLKGLHTKAAQVKAAITKCVKSNTECHKVIEQLESCAESIDSYKVKDTYTVVHAFIDKDHESSHTLEAKEAPEEYVDPVQASDIPYVYTGKCKTYFGFSSGQFRVLIKSDEEIMKSNCDKLQCGKKGKCDAENTSIPMCECEDGFYGENCEESLEDYKNYMLSGKVPES